MEHPKLELLRGMRWMCWALRRNMQVVPAAGWTQGAVVTALFSISINFTCVLAEHRGVAGLAGLAGVFVASMVSASWVVKASIGATTCTAIICWRCYAQPGGLGRLERSR